MPNTAEIQIQIRNGTAAAWTSANPTMLAGEIGYESDTGLMKYGDGTTAWTSLAYWGDFDSVQIAKDIVLTEQSDHTFTPADGIAGLWVKDDSPNVLMFTDDTGADFVLNGAGGTISGSYRFDTTTTGAGISSGDVRYDNAIPASVTELHINKTSRLGNDASAFLSALSTGDQIYIQVEDDAADFLACVVNAAITDNTTYFTVPVIIAASGDLPGNNARLNVTVFYTSASAGIGTGDVTKVGTPVDNEIGVWTGDGTLEGDPDFTWDGSTLTINAVDNLVDTRPIRIYNDALSGYYEMGAYSVNASAVDLRFEIDDTLRFWIDRNGEFYLQDGDLHIETDGSPDALQLYDMTATDDITASVYQEWGYSTAGVGGAGKIRMGYFGFSSGSSQDIVLKNEMSAGAFVISTVFGNVAHFSETGAVNFYGDFVCNDGAFTSRGIDDNATGERFQLADTVADWGASGVPYVHCHAFNDEYMVYSGGNSGSAGANFLLYGGAHPTLAGDFELRSGSNTVIGFDESDGTLSGYTGIGAKTLAWNTNSTQNTTFYGTNLSIQNANPNLIIRNTGDGDADLLFRNNISDNRVRMFYDFSAERFYIDHYTANNTDIASRIRMHESGSIAVLTGGVDGTDATVCATFLATPGIMSLGVTDTTNGQLRVHGTASGNSGGEVRLYLGADYDTTIDYFVLDANADDFRIIRSNDSNGMIIRGDTLNVEFADTPLFTMGSFVFDSDQTVGLAQDNYVLTYDNGTGLISLEAASGGGGTPGGSDTQMQYNNGGAFGGMAEWIYDDSTGAVTVTQTGTADALSIVQNGTGDALEIDHNGNGTALEVFSSATTASDVYIFGNARTSGDMLFLSQSNATFAGNALRVSINNAGASGTGLLISNSGTGRSLQVSSGDTALGGRTDIVEGDVGLIVGADAGLNTITNVTGKEARIGMPHYTNAEERFGIVFAESDASHNRINFGGGDTAFNNATQMRFHVSSTQTTTGNDIVLTLNDDTIAIGSGVTLDSNGIDLTGGLLMAERADHENTPVAAHGEFWVKDDTPNMPMFTDDAGTDHQLLAGNLINVTVISTTNAAWAPDSRTQSMYIIATGGGGGGGGIQCSNPGSSQGYAGAGGGTSLLWLTTIDATYNITIGAGGSGGAAGANAGGNGSDTTVVGSVGPGTNCNISAPGGDGGSGASDGSNQFREGVAGPAPGSGGDLNIRGGDSIGGGNMAARATLTNTGGDSYWSAGRKTNHSGNGHSGVRGAGGGTSSSKNTSTNRSGGDGGGGLVVIYEYS